jgi:hypothetical protein
MNVKNTALRLAGVAMVAVALAPWVGGSTASATAPATFNAMVKQDQVPVTAANFPGSHLTDCPDWTAASGKDSFHFVADSAFDFVSLTVEFSTGTVTTTTFGPPDAKHAYVQAPAGATLVNAWATLTPVPDPESPAADFQLSHVCVGTPVTSSSPPPSSHPVTSSVPATTPATVTSKPASVLATTAKASPAVSVKGTKAGTVKSVLPHTGSGVPVGLLLATSLALLLGGGALMMLPGLAPARGKRRRH